jgi:ribosomal protein S17
MHKYYCIKCKKYHHRGKIYKNHLEYKKIDASQGKDAENEGIKVNLDDLRPIAKRQLHRLYKKMKLSGNHDFYKKEIIKLIKNEKRR